MTLYYRCDVCDADDAERKSDELVCFTIPGEWDEKTERQLREPEDVNIRDVCAECEAKLARFIKSLKEKKT